MCRYLLTWSVDVQYINVQGIHDFCRPQPTPLPVQCLHYGAFSRSHICIHIACHATTMICHHYIMIKIVIIKNGQNGNCGCYCRKILSTVQLTMGAYHVIYSHLIIIIFLLWDFTLPCSRQAMMSSWFTK